MLDLPTPQALAGLLSSATNTNPAALIQALVSKQLAAAPINFNSVLPKSLSTLDLVAQVESKMKDLMANVDKHIADAVAAFHPPIPSIGDLDRMIEGMFKDHIATNVTAALSVVAPTEPLPPTDTTLKGEIIPLTKAAYMTSMAALYGNMLTALTARNAIVPEHNTKCQIFNDAVDNKAPLDERKQKRDALLEVFHRLVAAKSVAVGVHNEIAKLNGLATAAAIRDESTETAQKAFQATLHWDHLLLHAEHQAYMVGIPTFTE